MDSEIFNAVFLNSNMGILILKENRRITYINPFMLEKTGFSEDQLLGHKFYTSCIGQEDLREFARRKAEQALAKAFDDLDIVLQTAQGNKLAVHISGFPFTAGNEKYAALLIQDVTNRKAYEKVIESSFDKFIQTTLDLDAAMNKIKAQRKILQNFKLKMTRELQIAKGVQKSIIPHVFPNTENFSMFGLTLPSEELGGDYFDFFSFPDGRLGILVADVSGHGVPSSLITTMVKAYFENFTKIFSDPGELLHRVNIELTEIIQETGFYLTAILGVLDPSGKEIALSLAGHDCALGIKADGEIVQLGSEIQSTVLGVFSDAQYESKVYSLEGIRKIVFYTDGITEARNKDNVFFGEDRLQQYFKINIDSEVKYSCENLITEINSFYMGAVPNDDRTLVCINLSNNRHVGINVGSLSSEVKVLLKNKEYQAAADLLVEALEREEAHAQLQYYAGLCFYELKDLTLAKSYFSRALELNPEQPFCLYYLGRIALKEEQASRGQNYFERALEMKPDFKEAEDALQKINKKS